MKNKNYSFNKWTDRRQTVYNMRVTLSGVHYWEGGFPRLTYFFTVSRFFRSFFKIFQGH